MAAAHRRAPRPRLPVSEKRRIVELTLRDGASLRAIAQAHDISRNSLRQWQALYHAGKLGVEAAAHVGNAAPVTTLLPVSIASSEQSAAGCGASMLHVLFASGSTLRIETVALDAVLLRAIIAELRR